MLEQTKVSIIVRTCGRPDILKIALESIKKQTYNNIEIIVVEDGEAISEKYTREVCADFEFKYRATGRKVGRSAVGNVGLGMATGAYFNFLDDDDILYPAHVEKLLTCIQKEQADAAYGIAEESQIRIISRNPYKMKEKRVIIRYKQPYNKLLLCSFNYIPIQSIMFSRTLYDKWGGFDEELDFLEDWDLWVRYAVKSRFVSLPEVTSKYFVPYRSTKKMERNRQMEVALEMVKQKFAEYSTELSVDDINKDMDYILNVYNKKGLYYYLKMIRNFILFGEI